MKTIWSLCVLIFVVMCKVLVEHKYTFRIFRGYIYKVVGLEIGNESKFIS